MERELWCVIVPLARCLAQRGRPPRCQFTDLQIVLTYLWAALHERPVCWACRQSSWPIWERGRRRPTPSTMSRRLRTGSVPALLDRLEAIGRQDAPDHLLHVIDGKPLPISNHSHDPDAGYGRAVRGKAKGYKLHVIYSLSGVLRAWQVRPMQHDERTVAMSLTPQANVQGYLLADANYDSNRLYQCCAAHGLQLIAPRRYGPGRLVGHRAQSPPRLRAIDLLEQSHTGFGVKLFQARPAVERFFGTLSSAPYGLLSLPPWVRRFHRVRLWVQAKLIIFHVAQNRRPESA